jgi:hypothetical protein
LAILESAGRAFSPENAPVRRILKSVGKSLDRNIRQTNKPGDMKSQHITLVSGLAAALLLPSCATKFSPAQRAGLATVAVAGTTVDPEAYEEPYGGDVQMRNNSSNVPATGALGPLIGLGIGSAVAGTQNANFKGKNSGYFDAVRKNTPTDLGKSLGGKLKQSLKSDPFFRGRVAESSGNLVTSEISSYRLIRFGKKDNGDLTLIPEIYADIHLQDSAGKKLAGRTYIATGFPAYTVAEYAASSAKTKQAYDAAIDNAVTAFLADLAIKTRD